MVVDQLERVRRVKLTPLSAGDPAQIWLHHLQSPRRSLSLAARVIGRPEDYSSAFRRTLAELAPERALFDVRPLAAYVEDSTQITRFLMGMIGTFASLAIFLAALGLFSVLSYSVAEGRREIGIRVTLGATPGNITRGVIRTGLRLVGLGAILGLLGAYAATSSLSGLVFGVPPHDPVTFFGGAFVAVLVGLLACYIPVRRALGISPAEILS